MSTLRKKPLDGGFLPDQKKNQKPNLGAAPVRALGVGILIACAAGGALADGNYLSVAEQVDLSALGHDQGLQRLASMASGICQYRDYER